MPAFATHTLYFGDNLEVLSHPAFTESVDLVYLDPPFNSQRGYNLLFTSPEGHLLGFSLTRLSRYPDLSQGGHTFKRAQTESRAGEQLPLHLRRLGRRGPRPAAPGTTCARA